MRWSAQRTASCRRRSAEPAIWSRSPRTTSTFQTSGTLKSIDVRDDEYVHKGQLLGTLDSATGALTLKAARATLAQARTTLTSDEKTLATEAESSDTSVTVGGTIVSLQSIGVGDSVSSGTDSSTSSDSSDTSTASTGSSNAASTTGSSSSFVGIDSLRDLSMTVSFPEADISELKVGQAATVSLDALSTVELAGKVTAVSSLGTTTDDVVSYDATVTLDQYDSQVKPGMSASAVVIIKQAHGVTVPTAAVTGTGTLATVAEQVDGKDTTRRSSSACAAPARTRSSPVSRRARSSSRPKRFRQLAPAPAARRPAARAPRAPSAPAPRAEASAHVRPAASAVGRPRVGECRDRGCAAAAGRHRGPAGAQEL